MSNYTLAKSRMPSRLWLGPALSESSTIMQQDTVDPAHRHAAIPPVPALPVSPLVIPPRHSPALTSSSHETTSRSNKTKPRPKTYRPDLADRSKQSTEPPEVISNLIDSLATISFPDPAAGERFSPRIPNTEQYPNSPLAASASNQHALRHSRSFEGGDHAVLRNALGGQFSGIDDAAEPPVVRTTKPPSSWGQSPPNKLSKYTNTNHGGLGISSGVNSPTSFSKGANPSVHSIGSQDGNRNSPSKPGSRRRTSLISPSSETLDSNISPTKRSFKWTPQSSVRRKSAKPAAIQGPVNEVRFDALEPDAQIVASHAGIPSPRVDRIILGEHKLPLAATSASPKSSNREGKRPAKSPRTSPAVTQGPSVPNRRSSLRPQEMAELDLPLEDLAPMSFAPKKSSKQHSRKNDIGLPSKDEPKTLTSLEMLNGHDTEVTKRIKELKAKKEQRDREARDSPTPDIQVSLLATGSASDRSAMSSQTRRQTLADIRIPQIAKRTNNGTQVDDTDARPPTPLTPTNLPINYSFVVQSLSEDHQRPVSRSESYLEAPPVRPPSRPQSVGAIMRSNLPKASAVKSFWSRKDPVRRAATPDDPSGVLSSQDVEARNSNRRSTSSNYRRKRWSQPDLNDPRVNGSNREAIRETVYEERPSSQDTIGRAVDKFIHAQRLSQKIRHPGTGRVISFSEVGNPKGNVVFCCVGMGLTRFVTAFYDELANTLNLRLITPDRPGVGNSETDQNGTPLSWPDDVLLICNALNVHKFSILAHSAGAIYALATALRVPQHIRGKVHLLAPWIPPSQMETIGTHQDPPPPGAQLPKSQRFLRVLPAPLLKVANSSFLSATSASLSPNLGSPAARKKKSHHRSNSPSKSFDKSRPNPSRPQHTRRESIMLMDQQSMPRTSHGAGLTANGSTTDELFDTDGSRPPLPVLSPRLTSLQQNGVHIRSASTPLSPINDCFIELGSPIANDPELRRLYDERLTLAIWAAATTAANPAVDLLVCLERSYSIGFRYVDITRSVVIHHGAKDSRVPVDNVKWLGGMMRRCEVRVLEGESHGLMASASVMGGVLTEMAKEWADWDKMVSKGRVAN